MSFRVARPCGALLILLGLLANPALARDHAAYLDDAQLHAATTVLVAPSAMGSAEDIADRLVTLRAYTTADSGQAALARQEEHFDAFSFAAVLGPGFDPQRLPRTAALFAEVHKEVGKAKNEAKRHWQRERPCPVNSCQWDAETEDPDWKRRDFGYPSGHATRATVFALLLGQMVPQRAEALAAYAREVGWRRVVRGVHTPQDIQAGRVLGQALARALLASPTLQQDMAAAAREMAAAGLDRAATAKVASSP